jgi:hypothetical protein
MRKTLLALAVLVAVVALTPAAFAYNCSPRYQLMIGPGTWWEYVGNPLDTSSSQCWTLGGTSPVWNSTASMWEFSTWNDQTATRVVSVPSTDSGTSSWSAQFYLDFYDPHAEWWEGLTATVDVNHGGSHTYYTLYSNNGANVATDSGTKSVNFSAVSGDTVTLTFQGRNSYYGDAHVRINSVHIFRQG